MQSVIAKQFVKTYIGHYTNDVWYESGEHSHLLCIISNFTVQDN